jgi:hypothetical protein
MIRLIVALKHWNRLIGGIKDMMNPLGPGGHYSLVGLGKVSTDKKSGSVWILSRKGQILASKMIKNI